MPHRVVEEQRPTGAKPPDGREQDRATRKSAIGLLITGLAAGAGGLAMLRQAGPCTVGMALGGIGLIGFGVVWGVRGIGRLFKLLRKSSGGAMKTMAAIGVLVLGGGVIVIHPGRPLYMQHRDVEMVADDGVTLRGTISLPRWRTKPVPGVVLVHGSGPLTRGHVVGDVRELVQRGFAVLAYDKRGAGASSGEYLRMSGDSANVVLRRLVADAALAFDRLATDPDVDATRLGFFGASQAGWIIPVAAELTRTPPRFHVILSGPAVSTGVEQYYSDLTGDGMRRPRIADRAEVERLVLGFDGDPGFDHAPVLLASRVPTLWLLGDRDESVPAFASVRALDSIRAAGNDRHTVIRYANANHALRDVGTDAPVPIWDDMLGWLGQIGVAAPK